MVYTNGFPETTIDRYNATSFFHGFIYTKDRFRLTGYAIYECPNCKTTQWHIVTQYRRFWVCFGIAVSSYHTKFLVCLACLGVSGAAEKLEPLIAEFIHSSKPLIEELTQQIHVHLEHWRNDALRRLADFQRRGGRLEDLVVPAVLPEAGSQEAIHHEVDKDSREYHEGFELGQNFALQMVPTLREVLAPFGTVHGVYQVAMDYLAAHTLPSRYPRHITSAKQRICFDTGWHDGKDYILCVLKNPKNVEEWLNTGRLPAWPFR